MATVHQSSPPTPVPALAIQSGTSIGVESQYVDIIYTLLSSNVSNSLKSKIISSSYIDICLLLDNTSLIQSISRWTDAFLVYASIYASAHQESFQCLLKYLHDIRLGASRCGEGDLGWKKYDDQFRLRRSIDPTKEWYKVNYEL